MKIFLLRPGPEVSWKAQREGGGWIATCDTLRLLAAEKTSHGLVIAIYETMGAMTKQLIAKGELEYYLKEAGWDSIHLIDVDDLEVLKKVNPNVSANICEVTVSIN